MNKKIVALTFDDGLRTGQASIADYIIERARCGFVILLHVIYESGQKSRDALPAIVNGMREKGYEFVTVNELLKEAGD